MLSKEYDTDLAWQEFERPKRVDQVSLRNRLAEAQNWRCCYCTERLQGSVPDPKAPTLEVIVPKSRGGSVFSEDNMAVACLECNNLRGDAIWPIHHITMAVMQADAP